MKEYSERTCMCTLNRLFGFRPDIAHGIIDTFGSAREIFEAGGSRLDRILGPYSKISPLICSSELENTEEELKMIEDMGCTFICNGEPGFPALLAECPDSPVGLYYRSASPPEEVFNGKPGVAVVGTRDISPYGKEWCARTVSALASCERPPLICSGFAIGADIIAHTTALEKGLPTVAVLPTGIDAVYPVRHTGFAQTLERTPGCALITDYPPRTTPKAINFIRRNRIIAGICQATVLIESKRKGGGMITARLASSYGRSVLALPGRIDDVRSQGCNQLIQEMIAEPISDIGLLSSSIGLGTHSPESGPDVYATAENAFRGIVADDDIALMKTLLKRIKAHRWPTVEDLSTYSGLSYSHTSRLIALLESEDIISTDLLQRCAINAKFA